MNKAADILKWMSAALWFLALAYPYVSIRYFTNCGFLIYFANDAISLASRSALAASAPWMGMPSICP